MEAHFRDFIAIHKPFIADGYVPKRDEVMWMIENSTLSGSLMPHMGLFVPTIIGQASDDQQSWWLYRALNFEIIGGFVAMLDVGCVCAEEPEGVGARDFASSVPLCPASHRPCCLQVCPDRAGPRLQRSWPAHCGRVRPCNRGVCALPTLSPLCEHRCLHPLLFAMLPFVVVVSP